MNEYRVNWPKYLSNDFLLKVSNGRKPFACFSPKLDKQTDKFEFIAVPKFCLMLLNPRFITSVTPTVHFRHFINTSYNAIMVTLSKQLVTYQNVFHLFPDVSCIVCTYLKQKILIRTFHNVTFYDTFIIATLMKRF